MALLRAIATVGGYTGLSRVLGFVRDVLIAAVLGAGPMADAFFVAFKLPNLFRRLFAEGAFAAAFVPMFARVLEGEGRAAARAFAEQAFAALLAALLVFVLAAEVAMPALMLLFAPGFLAVPGKFELAVELARVTFPYLLFVSLVALLAGALNALGRFAAAAAAPILLNACLIAAVLAWPAFAGSPAHALALGVAAAGLLQFLWLYGSLGRAGLWLRPRRPRLAPGVRLLFRRILPVALGAGVYQVNLVVDMMLASLLPSGSISYLFYADRVSQLPLGVIGVAVGTALLPTLSRQLKAGEAAPAAESQNRALEFSLLLALPAAAALIAIAEPVIGVLFERGAFGPGETKATAAALAAFAAGVPAFVLVKALAPGFFAREDTKTPVLISVACMAANVVLILALMGPFRHVGIALATSLTSWLNAGLLAWLLKRRGHFAVDRRLKARLPRTALASLGMALALAFGLYALAGPLSGGFAARASALAGLVVGGLASFFLLAHALGAVDAKDWSRLFRRPEAAAEAPRA
jgi:putative peptidoglycan lipid II flippase